MNSMPFRQLKSFLKILIGVQYEKREIHTVFLRFPNFELSQKSRLGLLAKLCGVALNNGCACNDICRRTHFHYRLYLYVVAPVGLDISFVAEGLWSGVGAGD